MGAFMEKQASIKEYLEIGVLSVIYSLLFLFLRGTIDHTIIFKSLNLIVESGIIGGIVIPIQMFISVYIVLREPKIGFVSSVLLNILHIIAANIYNIRNPYNWFFPEVISCFVVLIVVFLMAYHNLKIESYIEKIEKQKEILKESEQRLHHLAFYDSLTDLPNKELFKKHAQEMIEKSKRESSLLGIMFVDLDSFKAVNDTMGHAAGDCVLKEISNRFLQVLRDEDMVSRFGGDEFQILITNVERLDELNRITNRVMSIFQKPVLIQDIEFVISASVGVSVYPYDGEDHETLTKNADIAMYYAKSKGKNQCVFCNVDMKNDILYKLQMTNQLYHALDNKEFQIEYQPQVDVQTKQVIGFEALIRWDNKEFKSVSPAIFIPIAESTGLIHSIGLWMIKTVCEQCSSCREEYGSDYRISINISIEQLKDLNFTNQISEILRKTNTLSKNIQIEITESIAFNEEPYVLKRIWELKNLGLSIAIDDFGTGYSSLSRLRSFPIDLIKIDMEFVRGISTNSHKEKEIIKGIIKLARNIGIKVLAEGVETKEEYEFLKQENCDEIQGFYFYEPLLPQDIKQQILNRTKDLEEQ